MKIRINKFRLHPRDEFDGRKMSYGFQLLDGENILGSSIIHVIVTGSIFPYWLSQLPQNPTEEDLGKLVLRIIETDLIQVFQESKYSIKNTIELKYWTGNNPNIEYKTNDLPTIEGYEISI